jgi:transporter family-2 protein
MIWLYLFFAFLAGVLIPAQSGINSQLARWLGHPILAALISFTVGTVVLLGYSFFLRLPWPTLSSLAGMPWWAWTGGFLGAATFISVALAGQVLASLALDHFGLVGFEVRSITPWRFTGALLVVLGVLLVRKF